VINSPLNVNKVNHLEYIGKDSQSSRLKSAKSVSAFPYSIGDNLLYIGYSDAMQSGLLDSLTGNETQIFQFATNITCPGTPTVVYEGQTYNTIQIFSQCWLKENLNVGTMINGAQDQSNNAVIEKYCYNDNASKCATYGGLYQWSEVTQYSDHEGVQGICPPNWHVPTDEEWKVLEGSVDSIYRIGDTIWDQGGGGNRGIDVGKNLKANSGWDSNGNGRDLFGFTGLAAGLRVSGGFYGYLGGIGSWWTSTEYDNANAFDRTLRSYLSGSGRFKSNILGEGYSVRCIKNH